MAATARPEIQVYASFPRFVTLDGALNLDADNWQWVQCLALPLERLEALHFSSKPYKWIRYAIGIIVGAEGDLSSRSDSLDNMDYNAGLPTYSAELYYHTSDEEKQRMFPVDPNIANTSVTSSVATTRRAQFQSKAAVRDGNRCVLSGVPEIFCDAVHLLAHSKGDIYISIYTQRRSRDPARDDVILDIDSIRNGLLLNNFTHRGVGKHVAFLPTPNFAMDTSDIDPTAPAPEKRCIAHLFEPTVPAFLGPNAIPSGTALRVSDTPDWPPAILFDAVYASTVLHHFGTQALKRKVTATWNTTFYLDGVTNQAHAEKKAREDLKDVIVEKVHQHTVTREARTETRAGRAGRAVPDTFDMLLALPYILVPPNELQATLREAKEKADAAEQRRVKEKVDSWNRQVTAS